MTDTKPFEIIFPKPEHAEIIGDFNAKLALETENKILDKEKVTKSDRELIEMATSEPHKEEIKSSPGFYLLAVETSTQKPIGCMMITYEMNLEVGGLLYCIQSVYVEKEFRR